MTDPRNETLTDKIATLIQTGRTGAKTSHEIAEEVMQLVASEPKG